MGLNPYLERNRFLSRQISSTPASDLSLVVVIPSHDEPDLIGSLTSLSDCTLPEGSVEVIVVINASEADDPLLKERNLASLNQAQSWAKDHQKEGLAYHFILQNELPRKHAGVGLARKIGMDEAVDRLDQVDNPEGVIVCFDADSRCESNYFQVLETAFDQHPKWGGASIHFEHPLQGGAFPSDIYDAITAYELHLRYHLNGLRYADHPQAYHTIGSSMAVRSTTYQKEGGMNRRKAGEDFYFLQKIIQASPFGEITDTQVIPSPRGSHRVPFGTGKAVNDTLNSGQVASTYPWQAYEDLKGVLQSVILEYRNHGGFKEAFMNHQPESIQAFLKSTDYEQRKADWLRHGTSELTFSKRFFSWFNAFRAMKYVHFARDHYYGEQSLEEALPHLMGVLKYKGANQFSEWLLYLRKLDRNR
ncbi:glycosyltransferase family 2 protein [bacterium SCSIO 12741]|nr:glycosyltransferase family 2 protein [bacterium SCSIO 12741]